MCSANHEQPLLHAPRVDFDDMAFCKQHSAECPSTAKPIPAPLHK